MFLAHSAPAGGSGHSLVDHLTQTASLAKRFADGFGAGQLAYLAGLWHDLGKFAPEFQKFINSPGAARGPDHSSAGAALADSNSLTPLAYLIAGHHGGLPSRQDLKGRIERARASLKVARREALREGMPAELHVTPAFPAFVREGSTETQELFLRMLFSALVDADFLDTEAYFYPEKPAARGTAPSLDRLYGRFHEDQQRLSGTRSDEVNRIRHEVYLLCCRAASEPPGLFRLTAPTGSGKTRSSMAFALRHALAHGMQRIVVAIPYTSIIDQTAEVYRNIFGAECVLEHHSAVGWSDTDRDGFATPSPEAERARLASQNWDLPVVVTTTVQLFESLFANRPSRCRKLHSLARSVLILDEVQMLPLRLLGPILDVIQDLSLNYGSSVVLCSATSPDFQGAYYVSRLKDVREIIPDPRPLFNALRRVDYKVSVNEQWSWAQVAAAMREAPQCMTVLNTRRDALALLEALADPDALHLSTLLCAAHRAVVLKDVRRRLEAGAPCRLVTTQVVEAGVDLDFPAVFRAVGPLDRIVQAAGRCNREGKLTGLGRVVVFHPADGAQPPGEYRIGADIAAAQLKEGVDLHDPSVHQAYFAKLAAMVDQDAKDIQDRRQALDYPEVARRFRLIDDDSAPVVVPYPSPMAIAPLLDTARRPDTNLREFARRLQPYMVSLREQRRSSLEKQGLIREVIPGIWEWLGAYDRTIGIGAALADPERFII